MKLEEYIELAKKELDDMEKEFRVNDDWPSEMDEVEWAEQELGIRFGGLV